MSYQWFSAILKLSIFERRFPEQCQLLTFPTSQRKRINFLATPTSKKKRTTSIEDGKVVLNWNDTRLKSEYAFGEKIHTNTIFVSCSFFWDCRIESTSGSESTELEDDNNLSRPLRRRSFTHAKTHDDRVDRVYTVGCFDLFHQGHVRLLRRMRKLGKEVLDICNFFSPSTKCFTISHGTLDDNYFNKQVIVGVHDSRSILKLKSRVPIDSTETRMANVKKYADIVSP